MTDRRRDQEHPDDGASRGRVHPWPEVFAGARTVDDLPRGPVEDLFARERDTIEELPGHDLHIEGILRSARTTSGRRRGRWGLVAVAAAAALVVGSVVVSQQQDAALDPAGGHVSSSSGSASTATSPSAREGFVVASLSAADDSTRGVLGEAACSAGVRCPVILRTADDGASWTNVAAFRDLHVASAGRPVGTGAVTELRWASAQIGYLVGSDVRVTRDGGSTWEVVPEITGPVLATEVDGETVRFVTGRSCTASSCAGPVVVQRASVAQPDVLETELDVDVTGVTRVQLVSQAGASYLSLDSSEGHQVHRVGGERLREPCEAAEQAWIAAPASGGEGLSVACVRASEGEDPEVRVRHSSDQGQTWGVATESIVASGEITGFAVPRTDVALLSSRHGTEGELLRSSDGGGSWGQIDVDSTPWSWLAAGGGGRVYALSQDDGYLTSGDDGATWERVTLAP